jgi:hypothetical protein
MTTPTQQKKYSELSKSNLLPEKETKTLSALEHFESIDSKLSEMRRHFEAEQKALQDQLFMAQAESRLARDQLAQAVEARAVAERIATKLLTQFGTVALIFEEAKQLAEEVARHSTMEEKPRVNSAELLESIAASITGEPAFAKTDPSDSDD